MRISRVGYTRCAGCLSHVKVTNGTTECPFCGDELKSTDVLGGTMSKLRSSRATLIAMGLAGGVTFAVACGEGENDKQGPANDMGQAEEDMYYEPDPGNDYGGFDPYDEGYYEPETDMGSEDAGSTDAGSSDAGSDAGDSDAGESDAGADQG